MKQFGLLAAAFGGTLAVLLVAFLVIEQMGAAGATATPSPIAQATATIRSPSPRPTPFIRPTPIIASSSPSVAPSATPTPTTTPVTSRAPVATPRRTSTPVVPGTAFDIVVPGSGFVSQEVPSNGTVTKLADGGVVIEAT